MSDNLSIFLCAKRQENRIRFEKVSCTNVHASCTKRHEISCTKRHEFHVQMYTLKEHNNKRT